MIVGHDAIVLSCGSRETVHKTERIVWNPVTTQWVLAMGTGRSLSFGAWTAAVDFGEVKLSDVPGTGGAAMGR